MLAAASDQLLDLLAALPGAAPVLDAVADLPGVHAVGGVPRDLLLGRTPLDLDLVVEGDALSTARAVAERLGGQVRAHDRFDTATVSAGAVSFDVAAARSERYPEPGALPEVAPASIDADLLRRDVSVNAIAVALGGAERGRVRSAPGALEDLAAGRLRVLHEGSFRDDPTRLLRVARYAARLGFDLEPATERLAVEAVDQGALATVSLGRAGRELRLALEEPDVSGVLAVAQRLGVTRALHDRLAPDPQLSAAALELLPGDGHPGRTVLAAACREIEAPALRRWLDALEFPAAQRETIAAAATGAPALAAAATGAPALAAGLTAAQRPSEIARAVGGAGPEAVALAGALGPAIAARRWLEELRHVGLLIDGGDLTAAGLPEGPAVGRGLAAALAVRLDGRAPDREAQLRAALEAGGG